ncbi:helix-turn-helix domain-containing protein [Enterobacter sp. RHBSTW-00994]|uniref:winged helix-turn-helix transcriptional regulator n=1 Tax=Enterobacteriaceae TaxID=543 RepID=UPI0015E92AF7|nr:MULTISPECIES: winged helix-turn-helix transcriptional regulator [Enterobacteriaceae]MBM3070836.1 Crp/Fnr family transcriptional regulator [Lelliottia sp. RWM.1]QLR42898.1 helix-turn-helix domain-containing protein [Enterobacter sp. RHBSTW-00994]
MLSAAARRRGSPYAREFISHLQPFCQVQSCVQGKQLDFQVNGQGMCYLILEGSVAVYRRKDTMLLSTATSPAIFGVSNLAGIFLNDYLITLKPCLLGVMTTDDVSAVIKEKDLWCLLSKQLMYVCNRLYHNIMPQNALTAYDVIRHQLTELMSEEESFRLSITAEQYIRDKTHLSRSGTMRILAALKAGNYVKMEEGRLIRINKLPAKY